MKAVLKYLATAVTAIAMTVAVVVSCDDYGAQIQELERQIAALEEARDEAEETAKVLGSLIAAVQSEDELIVFEPIAGEDGVSGFRVVFSQAGEIMVYNRPANISVGAENGRYYWMTGGDWLTDAAGNRIEINPETPVPQFRVADGRLEISVDGGTVFHQLGQMDKCLIESVAEDAAKVVFTLAGGATITIPKPHPLILTLEGDDVTIGAGESIAVTYNIEGAEQATVAVLCGDGWAAQISPLTATSGIIRLTAPSPIAEDKVIVFAGDGKGRMVAVEMRLAVDTSTNPPDQPDDPDDPGDPDDPDDPVNPDNPDPPTPPDPPDPPTPPDPPQPEVVLQPVMTAYEVPCEGGEIVTPLQTNVSYTVTSDADWLVYAGTRDTRTDNLVFTVLANDSTGGRAATATITSGLYSTSIAFCQAAAEPYLTVSSEDFTFDSNGGAAVLVVSSNVVYSYTAPDADWMELLPVGSTGQRYAIKVSTNHNTESRSVTIVFSGEGVEPKTVTISQAGQLPYFNISLGSLYFSHEGGTSGFSVSSNVTYTMDYNDAGWLEVSGEPASGLTFFSVTTKKNDTYIARSVLIVFQSESMGKYTVRVIQAACPLPEPAYPVPNLSGDIPPLMQSAGGAGAVTAFRSDDTGFAFDMADGSTVSFPRSETITLQLDDSRAITRGGGTVDVKYSVVGLNPSGGDLYVTVMFFAEGWNATVIPANGSEGKIRLKAPDPATRGVILVMASDSNGEMTAVQMHLKIEALSSRGPIPISHIMPCCRANNAGTKFLVNGVWNASHQYSDINQTRSILQLIQDAGINTVCIDFTNPSQWDGPGESAQHNGDGGEFWYQFKPMLDNIVAVCEEKDMEFIIFLGSPLAAISDLPYWNGIAGRVLDNWGKSPSYRRYGYGDDRPLAVMFCPGTYYASMMQRAKASDKNNIEQFRIGTCQVNSPITPTKTDGWGYRNYSQSNDGKVRFACPNGGVPPQDWYRVDAAEWRRRMSWVMQASEYAVIGSYDDTCDAIFWGIADVRRSLTACHRNEATEENPYIYYDIVCQELVSDVE